MSSQWPNHFLLELEMHTFLLSTEVSYIKAKGLDHGFGNTLLYAFEISTVSKAELYLQE